MSPLEGLVYGFSIALTPSNLIAVMLGAVLGTMVGVLPGIGPTGAIAILLTTTLTLKPETALIMLAGIFYGSMYGGSTTSILVNVPGEAASVVTCIDGYQMAKKGRAGAALAVAAVGSFVAGSIGILGLQLFAPPLARAALSFGSPEYCTLALLGIFALSRLSGGSFWKGILVVSMGLMIATVGMDTISGMSRYTFDIIELMQGIEMVRVHAPAVEAVDGCGAGATFSAGYVYGYLKGWNLADTVRFATAAASLKVTRAGLQMFSIPEIQALAATLKVEVAAFTDAPAVPNLAREQKTSPAARGVAGSDLNEDVIR